MESRDVDVDKKKFMKYVLPFVIIITVCIGLYALLMDRNTSVEETNQEQFAEKSFRGMDITKRFKEIEEVAEEPEEEPEEKEEVIEEKVENVTDVPVAPEKDLTSIIANAKAYVYTIDSDLEQGSGFLFNDKGDIVTNAHVAKDASYITVTNSNGQQSSGQVIGISDKIDIALIRVPELAGKQPMAMELSKVTEGTSVFALGSPENIANTSSEGKILSTGKNFFSDYEYKDLYEMDASIKKGSSGGPLIDAKTERILGINSIVLQDDPRIGYAIPMYTVINQLNEWASNAKVDDGSSGEDWGHVEEAYFAEDLLKNFIESYYELIPYSLNDDKVDYYSFYLLPGSQAEQDGKKLISEYRKDTRIFEAVKSSVGSIEIGDDKAEVTAEAVFTYHDQENDEVYEITHEAVYTVVIDEYGDYQIENMVIK